MTASRILLFTDFTYEGPYVGEMHLAIADTAPATPVFDLMHDAARGNPKAAAYLLAALSARFQPGDICVGVVDPGVGGNREPIMIQADGVWYVGPDNGLLELVYRNAAAPKAWTISWRPPDLSASFHGRDLFAPAAAKLSAGVSPAEIATQSSWPNDVRPGAEWPDQLAEVIYLDGFGNAVSGLRPPLPPNSSLCVAGHTIPSARTFSDVKPNMAFWYENSMGLIELAVNQNDASSVLGLEIGMNIDVRLPH